MGPLVYARLWEATSTFSSFTSLWTTPEQAKRNFYINLPIGCSSCVSVRFLESNVVILWMGRRQTHTIFRVNKACLDAQNVLQVVPYEAFPTCYAGC